MRSSLANISPWSRNPIAKGFWAAIVISVAGYIFLARPGDAEKLQMDLLASAFAPPYWALVNEHPNISLECGDFYPRSSWVRKFDCPGYGTFKNDRTYLLTQMFDAIPVVHRWPGEIRIGSWHPDEVIGEHIRNVVSVLKANTDIPIRLVDTNEGEDGDSDIVIVAFGSQVERSEFFGKTDLLMCVPVICDSHRFLKQDGYKPSVVPTGHIVSIAHELGYGFYDGHPAFIAALRTEEPYFTSEDFHALGVTGNFYEDVPFFKEGILFTPTRLFQVSGFILTEITQEDGRASGDIKKAECHIGIAHSPSAKRQLVSECILRALGLVNVVRSDNPSVLATNIRADDIGLQTLPTEWDLRLLRNFYRPELKSGTTKEQMLHIFENLNPLINEGDTIGQ